MTTRSVGPGVGPVTALAFRAAVDWPDRFQNARAIGAWLGLTPRRQQSGQIDRQGRISKRGDPLLRSYLFEAAMILLYRQQRASSLRSRAALSTGARARQAARPQAGGDRRGPQARGRHAPTAQGRDLLSPTAGGHRLSRSEGTALDLRPNQPIGAQGQVMPRGRMRPKGPRCPPGQTGPRMRPAAAASADREDNLAPDGPANMNARRP